MINVNLIKCGLKNENCTNYLNYKHVECLRKIHLNDLWICISSPLNDDKTVFRKWMFINWGAYNYIITAIYMDNAKDIIMLLFVNVIIIKHGICYILMICTRMMLCIEWWLFICGFVNDNNGYMVPLLIWEIPKY